ncbi:MAG: GEVED domain-containing protein [Lacibacter sp.]
MVKLICKTFFVLFVIAISNNRSVSAQCTNVSLNWDYLDYFTYTNNYTSAQGYLSSNLFSRTQSFAFGTQRVIFVHNYADASSTGESANHTAETGSYGTGEDIRFIGDGTVTITFENEVTNLQFSMYDVDRNQRVRFDARNAANVQQSVTLTRLGGGSSILTTSNGTSAEAQAESSTNVANTSVNATFNIDVAGPVKTITISIDQTNTNASEDGSFYLSDITACSTGSFTTDYFNVSRPFTGQPGYVLVAVDRSIYIVNPANGNAKLMFTDNTTPLGAITATNKCNINSFGYDPYNRILYYVYSLTDNPGANRMLRKYDFNTGVISTVLSDVSSTTYGVGVGIPLVTSTSGVSNRGIGMESAAAAFYDGSLYLGIETTNKSSATSVLASSNRETVIWKIDFDGSDVPYRASQVFAMPVDNGVNTLLHDWSDFVINNGMLYDFDGAGASSQTDIYQMDLFTRAVTNFDAPASAYPIVAERFVPGQVCLDWSGGLYNVTTTSPGGGVITPYIATYNPATGRIGTKFNITNPSIPATPSVGDAGEAFRPLVDFGDAPATFDPDPWSPALHERDDNLRLGLTFDDEWNKTSSSDATADGADEDGIAGSLTVGPGSTSFAFSVSVYNNTGSDATLAGWIDLNNDGVFQASEGRTITVPTGAGQQSVSIGWSSVTVSASVGSTIFLRLRLTSAANGMTTSNATGFFDNGEVEDYPVNIAYILPGAITFNAVKLNNTSAEVTWKSAVEINTLKYIVQRSADGIKWENAYEVQAGGNNNLYKFIDLHPYSPDSYYRIATVNTNHSNDYTNTAKLIFGDVNRLSISPNPTHGVANINITSLTGGNASISVIDMKGRVVLTQNAYLFSGNSKINLSGIDKLSGGLYKVNVQLNSEVFTTSLIIQNNK